MTAVFTYKAPQYKIYNVPIDQRYWIEKAIEAAKNVGYKTALYTDDKNFAQDLNLPPNFEVSLETDSLLQEAIDLVISKAGDDVNLTKLLIEFSKEKTDDDKNWDISAELLKVAQLITNENNSEEIKEIADKSLDDFGVIKKKLQDSSSRFFVSFRW